MIGVRLPARDFPSDADSLAEAGGDAADGGDSLVATILACAIVSIAVSGAAVAARFYARAKLKKIVGWEDWTILIAWVFSLGYTIAVIIDTGCGLGRHVGTLTLSEKSNHSKASWVAVIMFQLSLAFSKSSILLLYLRVLRYQIVYWATCTLFAVVILFNMFAFAINMTQCIPLEAIWDPSVKGDCHPRAYPMAIICIHIITDFLMFCLPLPVVLGMQLKLSQKIVLVLVFTLGFISCMLSIVRLIIWIKIQRTVDFTWDQTATVNWASAEVNTIILVSCVTVIRPVLARFWPAMDSETLEIPAPPPAAVPEQGQSLVLTPTESEAHSQKLLWAHLADRHRKHAAFGRGDLDAEPELWVEQRVGTDKV